MKKLYQVIEELSPRFPEMNDCPIIANLSDLQIKEVEIFQPFVQMGSCCDCTTSYDQVSTSKYFLNLKVERLSNCAQEAIIRTKATRVELWDQFVQLE